MHSTPGTTDLEQGAQDRPVFLQLFDTLVSSGLLASLSGSALKALTALGLASSPLGTGSRRNQALFEKLVRAGVVSARDHGRLYCCLRHRELMRRTGLSKNTLSRCTAELEAHRMVEKRRVHQAGGTAYNLFFLLPGAHVDKFNTLHPRTVSQPTPLPRAGTLPEAGTNYRSLPTATPPTTTRRRSPTPGATSGVGEGSLRKMLSCGTEGVVLAHFARRKGVTHYRPTAHDRHKLALLQQAGYSEPEILAAIDRAFDSRPADAPPVRMFSYCATVALATPPRRTPAPGADELVRKMASCATAATEPPVLALAHARRLYESEIGPVTPFVDDELRRLASQHPDPSAWDTAFREAVRANVRRLRYVSRVLEARARGPSRITSTSGGSHVQKYQTSRPAGRALTDEEYAEAQRRAAASVPLDLVAVLGTANA